MYWHKPNNHWKEYKGQSLKGQRGGLMSRWSACTSARSWAQPHSTYLKSHVRPCIPTFNPNVGRGRQGGLQGPAAYQSSSSFSKPSFLKRIRQGTIEQSTRHPPWASVSMHAHIHTKDGDVEVIVLTLIIMFSYIASSAFLPRQVLLCHPGRLPTHNLPDLTSQTLGLQVCFCKHIFK